MKLDPGFRREYRYSGDPSLKFWGYLAGGVALLVAAGVGFFLTLRTRGDQVQLTLTATLPTVFAVGLFIAAYTVRRMPRSVIVTSAGVTVVAAGREVQFPWERIAWSAVDEVAMSQQKRLTLSGADGKPLVRIPAGLDRFDDLVKLFKQRDESAPSVHATDVQWKQARKRGVQLTIGGLLALALGAVNAWLAYEEHTNEILLRERGTNGTAKIVRKFTAPDGVTRRIEFRVTDAASGGSHEHNVELEPEFWEGVREDDDVPVTAVPGRPDVARLTFGEVTSDKTSPKMMAVVSGIVMVLGVLFLVAGVFSFRGIDLHYESGTGFEIRRITGSASSVAS